MKHHKSQKKVIFPWTEIPSFLRIQRYISCILCTCYKKGAMACQVLEIILMLKLHDRCQEINLLPGLLFLSQKISLRSPVTQPPARVRELNIQRRAFFCIFLTYIQLSCHSRSSYPIRSNSLGGITSFTPYPLLWCVLLHSKLYPIHTLPCSAVIPPSPLPFHLHGAIVNLSFLFSHIFWIPSPDCFYPKQCIHQLSAKYETDT